MAGGMYRWWRKTGASNFGDIVAFLWGFYKDTQRGILPFGAAFPLLVHKFEKNTEEMSVFDD